jgi:hypothetical protein
MPFLIPHSAFIIHHSSRLPSHEVIGVFGSNGFHTFGFGFIELGWALIGEGG